MNKSDQHLILHALWLSLGSATSVGFARFGYSLMVPTMKSSLGWTYAQVGGMNSANGAGYLVGALLATYIIARITPRRAFIASALITSFSLIASGGTDAYWALVFLRMIGGVATAVLFIAGGVLGAQLASVNRTQSGLVLGIYYGGVGIGLILSGMLLPWLLESPLKDQWQWAWVILGILSLLPAGFALVLQLPVSDAPLASESLEGRGLSRLTPALVSYFLFGAGYIGYMTFVITTLRAGGNGSWQFISGFWGVLGLSVFLSSWAWAWLLKKSIAGRGFSLLLGVVCVGAALPLVSTHPLVMLGSAVLFGGSFLSAVAATTALVRKALLAEHWPLGIATFTVAFALGQTGGSLLTGMVLDAGQSSGGGLEVSAIILALATILALTQPKVVLKEI